MNLFVNLEPKFVTSYRARAESRSR